MFLAWPNVPAVAVANPAELRKLDSTIALVNRELLAIRESKAIRRLTFFLEYRMGCTFLKEIFVGAFQIAHDLLKCLRWGFTEEWEFFFPRRKPSVHAESIGELLSCGVSILLSCQSQVPNLAGITGELAHGTHLSAVEL